MPTTMAPLPALLTAFALVLASPANASEGLSDRSLTDRIDSWVAERMEARGIPGVAVAVVQDGETIHLRGYGVADSTGRPVQVDTPFLIGSASKPFTAHVVRELIEEGRISLDEPILPHVVHLLEAPPDGLEHITVRHLLTHTAGIASHVGLPGTVTIHTSDDALQRRVRDVLSHPLTGHPGERYEYSNAGYALLAVVVEQVTGTPFRDALHQRIFDPVGMADTFATDHHPAAGRLATGHQQWFGMWRPVGLPFDPAGVAYGYIGSSARDLSRFLHAHLNDSPLVPANATRLAGEETVPTGWDVPLEAGQGIGWMVDDLGGLKVVSHAGSLPHFSSHVIMVPDANGLGIAVLTNASAFVASGHDGQYEISLGLLDLMLGREPSPTDSGVLLALIAPVVMWLAVGLLAGTVARYLLRTLPHRRPAARTSVIRGRPFASLLPVIGYLALGAGLLLVAPLGSARLFYPDVGWAATAIAHLALACGVLRALIATPVMSPAARRRPSAVLPKLTSGSRP